MGRKWILKLRSFQKKAVFWNKKWLVFKIVLSRCNRFLRMNRLRFRYLNIASPDLRESVSWIGFGMPLGFRVLTFVRECFEEILFIWLSFFKVKITEAIYRLCVLHPDSKILFVLECRKFCSLFLVKINALLRIRIDLSELLPNGIYMHMKNHIKNHYYIYFASFEGCVVTVIPL